MSRFDEEAWFCKATSLQVEILLIAPFGGMISKGSEACALFPVKRIQHAAIGANIDHAVSHHWRGTDSAACSGSPQGRTNCLITAISLEGIQFAFTRSHIHHTVSHRW